MTNNKNKSKQNQPVSTSVLRLTALALCVAAAGQVGAFEIDTGNEDLQLRFDNTIRYNIGQRLESQSKAILGNANNDDGDRNFNKHSMVANRLDILTETDLVYKGKYGARVSAASWYDQAYEGDLDGDSDRTQNHIENGRPVQGLSNYATRYYRGPSGEIMDAFVFGSFDLGNMPLNARFGRHTVNWGESLLGSGAIHGISYGQAPLDQAKALALPGVEAKELYLPRTQLSTQLQVTPELSFAAQYFLEWRPSRVPEAGTYLGFSDAFLQGGESLVLVPGVPGVRVGHGDDIEPDDRGDWGVMTRWSPAWLDGTLGFYVRNFSDTQPQLVQMITVARATRCTLAACKYFANYADDIDMYGLSLSKEVGGISFGADVNYRRNMPLNSGAAMVTSAAALPDDGDVLGARGDTLHGVLNAIGSLSPTALYDGASWSAELTASRWLSVNDDPMNVFKGSSAYKANPLNIDAVTRSAYGAAVNFTPVWYQVFPGGDVSLPLSYSRGLNGNSAVASGGNEDAGSYAVGVALDLYSRYRFDLKYVDYFGDISKNANGSLRTTSGAQSALEDRGAVFFTFKTTL
ncbi:DUF1302 family protein [Pseudomonas sp. L-22-4S-12]|uniref:DUF1302 domain-containing protein n=1 Tax=Pseudomonas sp. L-22-4S-12 TaxID=2610893 RepID=UPI0013275977|nr:DUF1302 domain-containing protein [Pseudomonas sp. L-22-4S-12]MWV17041.1 DUF1302 family protein [Pseudomonas sp. L-22-4S-12]